MAARTIKSQGETRTKTQGKACDKNKRRGRVSPNPRKIKKIEDQEARATDPNRPKYTTWGVAPVGCSLLTRA